MRGPLVTVSRIANRRAAHRACRRERRSVSTWGVSPPVRRLQLSIARPTVSPRARPSRANGGIDLPAPRNGGDKRATGESWIARGVRELPSRVGSIGGESKGPSRSATRLTTTDRRQTRPARGRSCDYSRTSLTRMLGRSRGSSARIDIPPPRLIPAIRGEDRLVLHTRERERG